MIGYHITVQIEDLVIIRHDLRDNQAVIGFHRQMLIDEEFSCIKVFTYPDETDGYILFVPCCHGNQMLIFLRNVVIQNNDVILPFR